MGDLTSNYALQRPEDASAGGVFRRMRYCAPPRAAWTVRGVADRERQASLV
jgi:hypothetical protein